MSRSLLVTGAAGFIGANFVHYWARRYPADRIVAYDALTYAGNLASLDGLRGQPNFSFVHADICDQAIDPERNCFTQFYGSTAMDASLLMIPLVGFLPPDDPRILATVHEVARDLGHNGLLLRYRTDETHDGLAGDEGAFLASDPC